MTIDNLFDTTTPETGVEGVENQDGAVWEDAFGSNQSPAPAVSDSSYMDNLFAQTDSATPDWKAPPPTTTEPEDKWFIDSGVSLIKDLAGAVTEIPSAIYDWGEGFFSNKQTDKGIQNLSTYNTEMAKASSDLERAQVQQNLLKQGVITEDYFNQQQQTVDNKENEKQKYYQQATSGFKDELTEAVKPYLNQADKMQQKYILAAIESQVNQYGKQWSAIADSYSGTNFDKTSAFSQLNNEMAGMIKDTVVAFSQKIMEGKDSQQAYDELVPTMKGNFEKIAAFGLDVANASNEASREHFYNKMTWPVNISNAWATLWYISSYVQEAVQYAIVEPLEGAKQALLWDYDVVEDLQKMGVYSDTASIWEKAGAGLSHIGGNIVSGLPQIMPVVGIVAAEMATGNIPALAMLTKGSKLRTGIGEFAKDTLLYNGIVQTSLGRGMTEEDMAQNLIFDGPIDATLGLLEKPIKKELDEVWLKKFGTDYGFTPQNTVSQDVLNLMNKGEKDAAMTMHLADVSSGKMWDIVISSLDRNKQSEINAMQTVLAGTVDRLKTNTQTLKEGRMVDDAARIVLEDKKAPDVIKTVDLSNKIASEVQAKLADGNSYLSNKLTFNSISSMINKGAIELQEITATLDGIAKDLSGVRLGAYKATDEEVKSMVETVKKIFTGNESIPKTALDSPAKLDLFHTIQNELYKNIAITRSATPWVDIGRYIITDGEKFVDKVTRKELDKNAFIATINNTQHLQINKTKLEDIYGQLRRTDKFIDYPTVLGLTDIVVQQPHLENFVKQLYNKGIVIKKGQEGLYPAIMAGRIKNIIDGNLNLYQLTTNDLALMRMLILPWIIEKGKTAVKEIIEDKSWNLWNAEGKMNLKFANIARVNDLVKNVIKDGDASDIVEVIGDIVGVDKNLDSISKVWLSKAISISIDNIKNEPLKESVSKELETVLSKPEDKEFTTFYRGQKEWMKFTSDYGDAGKGLYLAESHNEAIKYLPKEGGKIYEFKIPTSGLRLEEVSKFGTATGTDAIKEWFDGIRETSTGNIILRDSFKHEAPKGYTLSEFQDKLFKDRFPTVSNIDGARIMHEVVDAVAEDKVLAQAVDMSNDLIKQDFSDGVVRGLITQKSHKIKILTKMENIERLKGNIGGSVLGGATIEPFEIKTIEDQVEAITEIVKAGGIDDKAFINKVVDSIGRINTWNLGLLSFDKIEQLTQGAVGKLLSWSRADIKFKTDTLANVKFDKGTLSDIKTGVPADVKNYIQEIDTIKTTVSDPIDMYRQILQKNYEYKSKIYSYILQGATGKYVDDLYKLVQSASDVRFLSTDIKIDKFMESVKADLLSAEVSDIHYLTYKSFNQIGTMEKSIQNNGQLFKYKQAGGVYYVKDGKMPTLISTDNISLVNTRLVYIVTNDKGLDTMKNPITVSGLQDSYRFISMNQLVTGTYEKGNPIYMSKRLTEGMMSSDGDKLKIVGKNDIVQVIQNILSNPDIKMMDIDVYAKGKEVFVQPSDLMRADTLFKIKTMESDLVYENAIKDFIHGFSTDTVGGFDSKYSSILNENKKALEYLTTLQGKVPSDAKIKEFFARYGVTDKSLIPTAAVVDTMFNEMYQYGSLFRTIMKETLQDTKPNKFVPLKNIASSYNLGKEYTKFLDSLPSNPNLLVNNSPIHDLFATILEENKGDITESATALYSMMIKQGMPLKDIREGMVSLFQVYGFHKTLPEFIHNMIFPTVDIFRAQQVADAVLSAVGGKNKQALLDKFNAKILGQLETFNRTHFGTDSHLIKLLENIQSMGYIQPDINIYKSALILGEDGNRLKAMLRQIYNGDIVRLLDESVTVTEEGEELVSKQYKGIQSLISKVIDKANMGSKLKKPLVETSLVDGLSEDELKLLNNDIVDSLEPETLIGSKISTKQEIDVSGIIINYKQSIDELIQQEKEVLSLAGNYGNTGKREIIWSDVPTHKIAGFGAENPEKIIETLKSKTGIAQNADNLFFKHPIRWGTSKSRVADNVYNALTKDNSANIRADAYNIIATADLPSEKEFIKAVNPTIYFQDTTELKMLGESNLETATFVNGVMNQILLIQEKIAKASTDADKAAIDKKLFTLETGDGFKIDINTDSLADFPIWKGYLNRLYKANPDFFGEPLNEMFVFKQMEQLNKFVNNVLVDIRKKQGWTTFFDTIKNPQLDTYRQLSTSLNKAIDNYSSQLGIAKTGFEQTFFETSSYAETLEDMLTNKKELKKILSKDAQNIVKNVSSIEMVAYTPIIKMSENGEEVATEKLSHMIDVDQIEEYMSNMPWQFLNKSEVHPWQFGLENMDLHFRATTRNGKVFDVKTGPEIEEIKEIELVWDSYKPMKDPIEDIETTMDDIIAKEYTDIMDTFTC